MIKIQFEGDELIISNKSFKQEYEILDAFYENGLVIVFLDPDAEMGGDKQYRNLLAYDVYGNKKWVAELPTDKTSDVYWRIDSKSPLIVSSFSSFDCEIDLVSGKVIKKTFYK